MSGGWRGAADHPDLYPRKTLLQRHALHDAEDCALGRSSLTDQTCGSQCLVAGAEGIRTAGPLWGSWRLRKGRSFSGVTALKPIQRIILRAICRQILVEKRPTSAPLQRGKRRKRTSLVACSRPIVERKNWYYGTVRPRQSSVVDGSDLRFAVPRCCSGGDSNRRSSLWFLALRKGSKFQRVAALKPIRELFSERSVGKL